MKRFLRKQIIENEEVEIGLFTFYRNQSLQEQASTIQDLTPKNKINNYNSNNIRKNINQKIMKTPKKDDKIQQRGTNAACDQFLKNIHMKQNLKKLNLTKKYEGWIENRQRIQNSESLKYNKEALRQNSSKILDKQRQNISLNLGNTTQDETQSMKYINKLCQDISPPSAEIIRKKYFNSERCSLDKNTKNENNKEIVGQQLSKYKKFTDEAMIKPANFILYSHQRRKSEQIKIRFRQFREKIQYLDRSHQIKIRSNRDFTTLSKKINNKQLHEKNKKYFNNLIQHLPPQYNQTAYKILKQTLKFPQFTDSKERIKTEGNSPQLQCNFVNLTPLSYYKNIKMSIKQKNENDRNSLKMALGNRLFSRKINLN